MIRRLIALVIVLLHHAEGFGGGIFGRAGRWSNSLCGRQQQLHSLSFEVGGASRLHAVRSGGRAEEYPIASVVADVLESLQAGSNVVIQAEPGAGKTSLVPLALLDAEWLSGRGRVVVLEPRRVAARMAAERMASLLQEEIGGTVGFTIRLERKMSRATKIEVVTEGVLLQRIASGGGLAGVSAVVFDEYHERSLQSETALALARQLQLTTRPDLRILVMSATLGGNLASQLLSVLDATLISATGRSFPVSVRQGDVPFGLLRVPKQLDAAMVQGIEKVLLATSSRAPTSSGSSSLSFARSTSPTEQQSKTKGKITNGDVLVFLPGMKEIRRVQRALEKRGMGRKGANAKVSIVTLHGSMSQAEQSRVVHQPLDTPRRVILSSPVAESSLTVARVVAVVDSGLCRVPRFDELGIQRLRVEPVSKARAEQRSGRAGRLAPGMCWRVWKQSDHSALPEQAPPEILDADLSSVVLALLALGHTSISSILELPWITAPPLDSLDKALSLLRMLGAVTAVEEGEENPSKKKVDLENGLVATSGEHGFRLSALGEQMVAIPAHPRLAAMIARTTSGGSAVVEGFPEHVSPVDVACTLAALLSEDGRVFKGEWADLATSARVVLEAANSAEALLADLGIHRTDLDRSTLNWVGAVAAKLKGAACRPRAHEDTDGRRSGSLDGFCGPWSAGMILWLAYPDRLARRKRQSDTFVVGTDALQGKLQPSSAVQSKGPLRPQQGQGREAQQWERQAGYLPLSLYDKQVDTLVVADLGSSDGGRGTARIRSAAALDVDAFLQRLEEERQGSKREGEVCAASVFAEDALHLQQGSVKCVWDAKRKEVRCLRRTTACGGSVVLSAQDVDLAGTVETMKCNAVPGEVASTATATALFTTTKCPVRVEARQAGDGVTLAHLMQAVEEAGGPSQVWKAESGLTQLRRRAEYVWGGCSTSSTQETTPMKRLEDQALTKTMPLWLGGALEVGEGGIATFKEDPSPAIAATVLTEAERHALDRAPAVWTLGGTLLRFPIRYQKRKNVVVASIKSVPLLEVVGQLSTMTHPTVAALGHDVEEQVAPIELELTAPSGHKLASACVDVHEFWEREGPRLRKKYPVLAECEFGALSSSTTE